MSSIPTYVVPQKAVIMLDHEKMIADLRKGPVYLLPEDAHQVKALLVFMRLRQNFYGDERPNTKRVTLIENGKETDLVKVHMIEAPVRRFASTKGLVQEVSTGNVMSLEQACAAVGQGLKAGTVRARIKLQGKSLKEASRGLLDEVKA